MGRMWSLGRYVGRPAWYDRTATPRVGQYMGFGVAPHALATRWTYTCPAGKKAMVEILQCKLLRMTAAAPVGTAYAIITLTPSGGAETTILFSHLQTNGVGDKDSQTIGSALVLCAGDVLIGKTYDGSTGGTVDYFLSYKITEFDA